MTQEEFNAMMEVWLANQATGGYYTSVYNGEEMDKLLAKVDAVYPDALGGG